MDRPISRLRNGLRVDGRAETINSIALTVLLEDSNGDVVYCQGATVPTADSVGFAKGCLFIDTDAADGTKGLYENAGTNLLSDFNLIGEITGAEIGAGAITSAKMDASLVRFTDVVVTAAEVKALVATPIELVPATEAGAGFAIMPIAVSMFLTYGSEVFTETADQLLIEYSSGADLMTVESTGFIDQASDQNRYQAMAATLFTPIENEAVNLGNDNDEIAGNASDDSTLTVRTYYRVVPVAV